MTILTEAVSFLAGLFDKAIKFGAGKSKGVGLVAENLFGSGFDAFLEFLDAAGCCLLGSAGLIGAIVIGVVAGLLQGFLDSVHLGIAEGFIEIVGEQGFGSFGLLAEIADFFENAFEVFKLVTEVLCDFSALLLSFGRERIAWIHLA